MQQTRIDFKKLRSAIALYYGIELDETSLTILAIVTQELKRQFAKMDKAQATMTTQIQYSKKSLQVHSERPMWQAFWHGMGQWGLGLCLAVVLVAVIFSIDLYKERKVKLQLQQELSWYKKHYEAAQTIIKKSPKSTKK